MEHKRSYNLKVTLAITLLPFLIAVFVAAILGENGAMNIGYLIAMMWGVFANNFVLIAIVLLLGLLIPNFIILVGVDVGIAIWLFLRWKTGIDFGATQGYPAASSVEMLIAATGKFLALYILSCISFWLAGILKPLTKR